MVLPVKVSAGDATRLTHRVDITCAGARLGGLQAELQPGRNVLLRRGLKRARFRVVWVKQLAANEIRAGLECLEPQSDFLGIDLSEAKGEGNSNPDTLMTLLSKKSKATTTCS
jgi:hypothetical protein